MVGLSYSHVYSLWKELSMYIKNFDLVTLNLFFDLLFKNFNIGHNFWIVSDRAFIFHICNSCDKTFSLIPKFLDFVTMALTFDLLFLNFNIVNNFWLVRDRAFIFYMCNPCDETFPLIPTVWPHDLDLWPTFQKL